MRTYKITYVVVTEAYDEDDAIQIVNELVQQRRFEPTVEIIS